MFIRNGAWALLPRFNIVLLPIYLVVAKAAEALLKLAKSQRSNEQIVSAILIQINDLLRDLFE